MNETKIWQKSIYEKLLPFLAAHAVTILTGLFFHTWYYSLISMTLIYCFDTWAIIWHGIVPVFLNICTDLQEKYKRKIVFVIVSVVKLFRNNKKNNFAFICCKFLANLCKSSKILEQCHVKWWLKYRNNRSVSWRLSCTAKEAV